MKKILDLIRFKNLVFIVFIQYSMRYFIVKPILENKNLNLIFSNFNFILLVLTTVFIAAGGYIINNYFDAELDSKAHKKNEIGKSISKKSALNIYFVINIIALAVGFYISYLTGIYKIGFIFLIISGLLWLYSSYYKKKFLVGNIIVALMAALVPFIVGIFEISMQYNINKTILVSRGQNLVEIIYWLAGFAGFAFITTLIREIIKDTEDLDGDMSFGANTLPIIAGIKITKIITIFLTVITISAIAIIILNFLSDLKSILFTFIFIILPFTFFIIKNIKAKNSKDFHFLSIFIKIIMFAGVSYSFVAYLNF